MEQVIINYLTNIIDNYKDLALDYELDLKSKECDGDWRKEVNSRLKKAKSEITKLNKCIKFLKKRSAIEP